MSRIRPLALKLNLICCILIPRTQYAQAPAPRTDVITQKRVLKLKGLIAIGISFYYIKIAAELGQEIITNCIQLSPEQPAGQLDYPLLLRRTMTLGALLYICNAISTYGLDRLEEEAAISLPDDSSRSDGLTI